MLSMVPIYKLEYDYQFINKGDVKSYVLMKIITQEEYREIVGEEYEEVAPQPKQ